MKGQTGRQERTLAQRPVALVTGAARRIGRAIALELARTGHDLALHCHASVEAAQATLAELRALGVHAELLQADLADEAACRALLPLAVQRLGRVDVLVNNASLFEYDDARSAGPGLLERHWRTNTAAPLMLTQALAEHLDARRAAGAGPARGCVVNLLDQKLFNPNPDYFSYTLSKAALREATVLLAQALAPHIRVVGVAPGLTDTSPLIDPQRLDALQAGLPLGHGVTPAEVAAAVAFLVASPSITGHVLVVDAGSHLAPSARDFAFMNPASETR